MKAERPRRRCLLVDDEEDVRNVLSLCLQPLELGIDTASDGREGMMLLRSNHYDVITTGILMPNMNGLEFLENIKRSGIDTPVLVVTAASGPELIKKCYELGASSFLRKPVEFVELQREVRRLLGHAPSSDEARDNDAPR